MEKFGDIINVNVPVLICFFADWHDGSMQMNPVLRETTIVMGDEAKIIKVDVDKNKELTRALKIDMLPTLIMYHNFEMVWRKQGFQDSDTLTHELRKYA
ncbi:thioredoxin family protein [Capnocytophaga canimorsus]|uniref:Thioredoxin n=2 Tax=Capnocytophaga canimorsus TaxID=28188 RepID=F9YQW9_CAPCC|nr:thioredoxin family protein [Capnocytophaga canimorsus]AEK22406.1 Thioredoxin [Capnocytophaga canimorsus Cc5]ATA78126.1 thiol reductase thioredoxin [Capnocytophaga canimorsus]ATA92222.1 thiol reductase thioredoxin [Capnocytophaga canimorsus]ATA94336.1 thiol reductase thioredoxin [Capnocytophaga canimorsus]AWL79060.1 thioredoxin [Capnocytophaga canimorsus]